MADKVKRRYTERTLQLAIEACLDLTQHIISGGETRTQTLKELRQFCQGSFVT